MRVHGLARTKNQHDDCYFCVVSVNGIYSNNHSNKWIYPDLLFAKRLPLVFIQALEPIPAVLPSISAAASYQLETDDILNDDKSNEPDFIPMSQTFLTKTSKMT